MAEINAAMPVFQFQPETVRSSGAGASGAAPRLGVSGGEGSRAGVEIIADTRDLGAGSSLPAFLEEAFAPKLKAVQQQKFWSGFTAARAGKSAADIHAEQPWYAHIFGPTSYELGAETFAVQKAASDMETQFLERLPELRKMSPEEVGVELNTMATNMQTGNLYTDALIQKSMMERAGPMMDTHMKARYAWQQEELARGQNSAWLSASSAFQAAAVDDAKRGREHPAEAPTVEQLRERGQLFLQTFQSPEGQNPESYLNNLLTTVDQMADQGDWYSIRALEASGLLGQLPPEDRDKLDGRIDRARSKYKRNLASGPLMKPIAQLFTQAKAGAISAESAVNGMFEINAQYAALTGDDTGLFDQDDAIRIAESAGGAYYSMWERMMNKRDAAIEKAQTAAEKEAAEARGDAQLVAAVTTNSIGTVSHMKGVTTDDADRAFNSVIDQNPAMLPEVAVGNYAVSTSGKEPYVSARLKTRLQNQVALSAGEEYTDGFEQAYQAWRSIRYHEIDNGNGVIDRTSGLSTAIEYYGPFQTQMQAYDDQVRAGTPREIAYRRAFGNEASYAGGNLRGVDADATKAAREQLTTVVQRINPSWWQLGSESMGSSATNVVTNAASRYFEQIKRNDPAINDQEAANQAVQMAQANGLEISGRYAWQNVRGQKPLYAEAGMQKDVFEDYFEQALTNRFRAQGMRIAKDTSVSIIRIGNDTNGPRLMATAYRDGERKTIWITGDDIKKLRNQRAEYEVQRNNTMIPGQRVGDMIRMPDGSLQRDISIQPKL